MSILEKTGKIIKYWYAPLISGIVFIGAGILSFIFTKATVFTFCLLFSLSFLLSGVLDIVSSVVDRKNMTNWGWTLILGVIHLLFGILLLTHPFGTMIALALFVGLSVLFRSIGGIILSINIKSVHPKWFYLLALGILGIVFSIILVLHPLFAWTTIIAFTGITLIVVGIFSICLSFFLKGIKERYREFINHDSGIE